MPANPPQVLLIGEWRVDSALGEIVSDRRSAKLDPLPMRLLLYLAANAGRVVAVQELLEAVWPDVLVTAQSVYNTVAQLRTALGDVAATPHYIATIPRRGYRLIAPVRPVPAEPVATATAAAAPAPAVAPTAPLARAGPTPAPHLRPPARGLLAALLIALIGISLFAVLALLRPQSVESHIVATNPMPGASIAVLPFRDLSEARDHAFLAEGLTEEIGSVLARVPSLRVIGRASASAMSANSVTDLAPKLVVDEVVTGSVQSSAHGLRITAALIQNATGQYLWSKTFNRATDDYYSVEDEIADAVAEVLTKTRIARSNDAGCARSGEANDLLLRGRYLGRRNAREERAQSIALYQQALALEPDCARAWAWLSTAYAVQAASGWAAPDHGYESARAAAERGLRLDPLDPDSHVALAYVAEYRDWNFAKADDELKRARALDAGDVRILNQSGHLAMDLGQVDRALEYYQSAASLDPLSPGSLGGLAAALWISGQLPEAEHVYREAAAISPARYHTWIALVLLDRHELDAAREEIAHEPDPMMRMMGLGIIESAAGHRAASDRALTELLATYSDYPYEIAQVYARRGDSEAAFRWLERAYDTREANILWLKVSRTLLPLRADPRFDALLRRMGVTP
jgi:TolB-like protein/DNA-binding winged helix-turn-helix (wHTH) protein/Flp pilus assembly protein TadD